MPPSLLAKAQIVAKPKARVGSFGLGGGHNSQGEAMGRLVQLTLTSNDALIIILSIQGDQGARPLLMRLFSAYGGVKTFDLEAETLWFLFHNIVPTVQIGGTTGLETLTKVGQALAKFYPQYFYSLSLPEIPVEVTTQEELDASRDTSEDPRDDPFEGATEDFAFGAA